MTSNKIAIITGASRGIGRSISLGLAELGYKTILIGRNKNDLKAVAKEIKNSKHLSPEIIRLDITDSVAVKNTVKQIVKDFDRIDILVNNAGIYFDGSADISETDFSKMIETNLTAQYVFLTQVVPVMKEQKSGSIFNIASRAGKIGFAGSGGYSASKFGLVGLSESLYRELSPFGISVTALCPGWVNTKMAVEAGSTLTGEQMIQPDDLFKTIKWLLSLSPGACVKEVVLETPHSIS